MATNQTLPWKALREATGLSQREIERRLGWKHGRLSVIERGLVPSVDEAAVLRRVLVDAIQGQGGHHDTAAAAAIPTSATASGQGA